MILRTAVAAISRWIAIASFVLALAASTVSAQSGDPAGVPVRLDGKELFRLRHGIDQIPVDDRARLIEDRLYDLALNPFRPSGDFELRELDDRSEILFGGKFVMAVTDEDAAAEGVPRSKLVAGRLDLVELEVAARRTTYWKPERLAVSLLATVGFTVAMWFFVGFVRRRLAVKVAELSAELPEPDEATPRLEPHMMRQIPVRHALVRVVSAARTAFLLASVGFYAFVVLSLFPRSRFVAASMLDSLVDVFARIWKGLAGYAPNLLFLLVIVLITYVVIRVVRFFFAEISRGSITLPGFEQEWAEPTYRIAIFLVIALAAVMVFPYLPGADSQAFQAVSLFLGLLISLSSSSAISNMIAGVILTYTGAFRMGDRVKIAEAVGDVVGKTLLVTRVRTIKNVDIAIPNALVLSSHIVNYSRAVRTGTDGVILHTSVTIGYGTPWRQVHELLIGAALKTADVAEEPRPFILQTSLNDFYVTYELNVYTKNPWRMAVIYSDLHTNIQDAFNEAGVEIMSPHFASVRDGNAATIPETYLPENYQAPAFRILPK